MRVLLLSNQPERTTRLMMFKNTLEGLGYDVIVPKFKTRNWLGVASEAKETIRKIKPDVIHLFNVPDIIYHGLIGLKGYCFRKLIYDYRSPWGVEMQMTFGPVARPLAEHFERELVSGADIITAVNRPLADKVSSYREAEGKPLFILPNYPSQSFVQGNNQTADMEAPIERPILFIGRISRQEGIGKLLKLALDFPEERFWIVGDGPFAWWYLRNPPKNVKLFGYQPHERIAPIIRKAKLCLILLGETLLTPYATDKSVWKLNEYLCMEKIVVASGVTMEEERRNLIVAKDFELNKVVGKNLKRIPEKLNKEEYRFWEKNDKLIKEAYESLKS